MNKFFVFFIVTLLTFNISFANEENFIDGFEDIPMITGMHQETNNDIFFNNEETRYIETNLYAYKPITYEEFANFYTKTLPQLGWTVKEKSQNEKGYYAFVCESCAPSFSYHGYFMTAEELKKRAKEIYDGNRDI